MASLKELRESKGLTQEQVASRIGVSRQTYLSYESNIGRVKMWRAQQIADALGVELADVLESSSARDNHEVNATVEDIRRVLVGRGYSDDEVATICDAMRPVVRGVRSGDGEFVDVPVKGVADCTW